MSDVQAAYILQYLERFNELITRSEQLYSYFVEKLGAHKEIRLFPNYSDTPPFLSCLSILTPRSDQTIKALLERNIYCRKYYTPLEGTPVSTYLYNRIVCISFTVDMTTSDIDTIVEILTA
jgi:dTDP-4-amino-4,6-dideoxygalactose transaminase